MLALNVQHCVGVGKRSQKAHYITMKPMLVKVDVNVAECFGGLGGPMLAKWTKLQLANDGNKCLLNRRSYRYVTKVSDFEIQVK